MEMAQTASEWLLRGNDLKHLSYLFIFFHHYRNVEGDVSGLGRDSTLHGRPCIQKAHSLQQDCGSRLKALSVDR